jgi:hypothetical protein
MQSGGNKKQKTITQKPHLKGAVFVFCANEIKSSVTRTNQSRGAYDLYD